MPRAYGIEMGGDVIVDPTGKIAGFTSFLQPEQLSAVLDGRAVAILRGTEDDEVVKLLEGGKVRLEADPERHHFGSPGMPANPDIAPS